MYESIPNNEPIAVFIEIWMRLVEIIWNLAIAAGTWSGICIHSAPSNTRAWDVNGGIGHDFAVGWVICRGRLGLGAGHVLELDIVGIWHFGEERGADGDAGVEPGGETDTKCELWHQKGSPYGPHNDET